MAGLEQESENMTIMISYSRLDKKEVDAIVSDLKATGLKTWQDITDMKPGDEWRQILLRQPMTVNAFIPFLSGNYVNSEMCRLEYFRQEAQIVKYFQFFLENAGMLWTPRKRQNIYLCFLQREWNLCVL